MLDPGPAWTGGARDSPSGFCSPPDEETGFGGEGFASSAFAGSAAAIGADRRGEASGGRFVRITPNVTPATIRTGTTPAAALQVQGSRRGCLAMSHLCYAPLG